MNQRKLLHRTIVVAMAAVLLLTACGSGAQEPTPTLSVEQIQTQAVATFAADLTATALSMPTETPTATETATSTATSTAAVTNTPAGSATAAGAVPTGSCYGMSFVSDVTIPDNTQMTPGQQFTKTWRVRNSGSCAWSSGFQLRFTGGEAMGGSSVTLENAVQAGQEVDLSVTLTAPTASGTYRGNWRMVNSGGTIFGDEIYVQVIVGGSAATATVAASATPTPTSNATPLPTNTATDTQ